MANPSSRPVSHFSIWFCSPVALMEDVIVLKANFDSEISYWGIPPRLAGCHQHLLNLWPVWELERVLLSFYAPLYVYIHSPIVYCFNLANTRKYIFRLFLFYVQV